MTEFDPLNRELSCSYYNVSELGDRFGEDGNSHQLTIFHHNVRSFSQNYDKLSMLLSEINHDIDVIVLSETWHREGLCNEIDGYVGHHVYRSERTGGGVSVYTRVGLKCCYLSEHSVVSNSHEICAVEITPDTSNISNNLVVYGVYRPPDAPLTVFTDHIDVLLSSSVSKSQMLCGDLNLDLLDDSLNCDIFNTMYSYNFLPLINLATRVTDNSAKCIDHIWYNKLNISFSGCIPSDISDHYPIFTVVNVVNFNNVISKVCRNLSEPCLAKFYDNLSVMCQNFFNDIQNNDVNFVCNLFIEKLWFIYNRDCPKYTKTVSFRKLLKPWITSTIRRMANYKHNLFKKYKNSETSFEVYNQYKNNLNRNIKLSKKAYYERKFDDCKNNIKKTWQTINSVLCKSKKQNYIPVLLDSHGVELSGSNNICEYFCNHFSTIADKLDADIPRTMTDPMDFMPDPVPDSFTLDPTTPEEIQTVINSFSDKPASVNTIPVFIYKKIAPVISPILCIIFNESLTKGIFPSILKLAKVIPLHKAKSKKIVNNYRPISIIPFISKLFEKIMKKRAIDFITRHDLLFNRQFGFRRGCSTTDAILHYVDDCATSLDNRLYTISIFLDFSKAFDTVNKDIMLRKLDRLGFRGVSNRFFESYLTDRRMYVSVNGGDSTTRTTNIGLPQGSVSAPWLFGLYINDLHRTSTKLKFIHFADDTTVYMSGKDLNVLCREVCVELDKIDDWLQANRLSLNIDKTCFMIHTHYRYDINDVVIKIRDRPVTHVRSTKFLGLTIDDRLSYNDHVTTLHKSLCKTKGILYKISSIMPPSVIRNLYYSLFYSLMSYVISVWGGGNITNINKIRRINNRAIDIFAHTIPEHVSQPLAYDSVYTYFCLTTFHKYVHNEQFSHFHQLISCLVPDHIHNTRFNLSHNYCLPAISKTVTQNQFIFNAVKLWNLLPQNLKLVNTHLDFKNDLKKYLKSLD